MSGSRKGGVRTHGMDDRVRAGVAVGGGDLALSPNPSPRGGGELICCRRSLRSPQPTRRTANVARFLHPPFAKGRREAAGGFGDLSPAFRSIRDVGFPFRLAP